MPERRRENGLIGNELHLIEGLAVVPLLISILPHIRVGCVHHCYEDVEDEDDGDALVSSPHEYAHEVRELNRLHVHVYILRAGILRGVAAFVDNDILRTTGRKHPPVHGSDQSFN